MVEINEINFFLFVYNFYFLILFYFPVGIRIFRTWSENDCMYWGGNQC